MTEPTAVSRIGEATSVAEFARLIEQISQGALYRGVKKSHYLLVPKIGRYLSQIKAKRNAGESELLDAERDMFRVFERYCRGLTAQHPSTDFEILALAQHHGMPTRLLDWSFNALAALYFAVEGMSESDSLVYVLPGEKLLFIDDKDFPRRRPFGLAEVQPYLPPHFSPRIAAQDGLFTVHPKPWEPYQNPDLSVLVVPRKCRRDIRYDLDRMGVNRKLLFPDLNGLSDWLQWRKLEEPLWDEPTDRP